MPKTRIRTNGAEYYIEFARMEEPTDHQWERHSREQNLEEAVVAYLVLKAQIKNESIVLIEEIVPAGEKSWQRS